jgi:HlyD family secretion protein
MAESMDMTTSARPVGKRKRRRWPRRAALGAFALLLLLALVYGWMPKPVPVEIATARKAALRVTVDEDGKTRVRDRFVVAAPLSGTLERITLRPGDSVSEGQVVARVTPLPPPLLDPRSRAEAEARVAAAAASREQAHVVVERAREAAAFADRDLETNRRLAQGGSLSSYAVDRAELEARTRKVELSSAELSANVADHDLEVARAALVRIRGGAGAGSGESFAIASPAAARVLRVVQESQGPVQAGAPLLELGDPAALEVVVDVLSTDAVRIREGNPVTIDRWGGGSAGNDRTLTAHVRRVEPSAFTKQSALGVEEQRVNVIIDLDAPREQWTALGDGFRVEAHIAVWEGRDVLLIPSAAVFRNAEGWASYTIEEKRAKLTHLRIGERSDHDVQVLDGLADGAFVIVNPSDQVANGVRVAAEK